MAATGDPWRILGLTPGASPDAIRRAYRALAKINHPDAAGEAALPRFLAIQAAYEQLAGSGRARRAGSRPGGPGGPGGPGAPGGAGSGPREPWRADSERARASGRADGRRPGARPTGRTPGAGTGAGPDPAAGSGEGSRAGAGPAGAAGSGGPQPGPGGPAGRARRSSSRRARKTATPYSTSYDPADEEPFEPGWTGGTWYGASSGTYWTINPKEYADPRKHGPEYQARARRARAEAGLDSEADDPAAGDPGSASPPEAEAAGAAGEAHADPGQDAGRDATADDRTAWTSPRRTHRRPPRPPRTRASATAATGGGTATWARGPGDAVFRAAPPGGAPPPRAGASPGDSSFRGPVLPRATTPSGRFATALLGWPPLALFAGATIGESTGCGRYAASCSELSSPGTWIVAAAILLLLLALPAVATWSAHGSIAALVVGVPSAVILSAAGGTNLPQASAPLMLGVLAVAYLAGVAYGLLVPRLAPSG